MAGLNKPRAQAAMREFLLALGHDVDSDVLRDTPARVTDAYADELLAGYSISVPDVIAQGSEPAHGVQDPIVLKGLAVVSVCPHHLLPAEGDALVAYLPGRVVLGLGTIKKLVDAFSRRLVLQEEIAGGIADALVREAGARGAFVRVHLRHGCLRLRGPEEHAATVTSFAARGVFSEPEVLSAYQPHFFARGAAVYDEARSSSGERED
jgi:GTP cyclohydrolase I